MINDKLMFAVGQLVATPGALAALREASQSPAASYLVMFVAIMAMSATKTSEPTTTQWSMASGCYRPTARDLG